MSNDKFDFNDFLQLPQVEDFFNRIESSDEMKRLAKEAVESQQRLKEEQQNWTQERWAEYFQQWAEHEVAVGIEIDNILREAAKLGENNE